MMRLLRPHPGGIFWRSFRFHSTHYARETIAKICSPWVIALRSPCFAQARGDHPWSPVRRVRRTLATAIISQTGSCGTVRIGTGVGSPCIVLFAVIRRLR
jgi:hypothetical protein